MQLQKSAAHAASHVAAKAELVCTVLSPTVTRLPPCNLQSWRLKRVCTVLSRMQERISVIGGQHYLLDRITKANLHALRPKCTSIISRERSTAFGH